MTGTYLAPAKINLGLEVLYKRPDGYHELNTLFCRVDAPHDTITVSPASAFLLSCSDPNLATDSSNLVHRAAEKFCAFVHQPLPRLHIHLTKNIPSGAGLGGGSSDAATMLTILNDWYYANHRVSIGDSDLNMLAAQLGADVPFFLSGVRLAQAAGIGELLQPFKAIFHATVVIAVNRAIQISTKEAYAALHPTPRQSQMAYRALIENRIPISRWKEQMTNDFEPEIFRRFPKLAQMKHSFYAQGASFALMSGSGSAIYGLFDNPEKAAEAQATFEREGNLVFSSSTQVHL